MYYKGIQNCPSFIKTSIISIEKNSGKHPLYKLDKYNYDKYILLPKFLLDKLNNKIFNISHFLEILRMGILSKYGGFWIDLTFFNIVTSISFYSSLLTFKLSTCNQKLKKIIKQNNFFFSSKNSFLTTYSYKALLIYWKYNNFNTNYLFEYIIYFGYQSLNGFKNYIDKLPYLNFIFFSLNKSLNEDYHKKWDNYNSIITTNEYVNDENKNYVYKTNNVTFSQ